MPRKVPWPPPLVQHHGHDYIRVRRGPGDYQDIRLGPEGSEESRREYARILAEMSAAGGRAPVSTPDFSCAELVDRFLSWAERRYEYRQYARFGTALGPVSLLYGPHPTKDFGPLSLKACRQQFVESGYCRRYTNQLVDCIRWVFRWGVGEQLVPTATVEALGQVISFHDTDPDAPHDHEPVRPVELEVVQATLKHLWPETGAMVRLQLYTGMRPGEVCLLRPCDIDTAWKVIGGKVIWLYRLDQHKGRWRGHLRWVPIGPQGQEVLAPFLKRAEEAYCFNPNEALEAWRQRRRETCKTGGRKPKNKYQRVERPRKSARDHYSTQSYGKAIGAACKAGKIEHWSPNQIRHLVATQIETELGREDARVVLGHTTPSTTARYAESVERAAKVIASLG